MEILSAQDSDAWRAGRVACLEKVIRANLTKLARIQTTVRRFARARYLERQVGESPVSNRRGGEIVPSF
ncbi:MAG: hypothetical protein DMF96_17775 [Acidobacteria bacterium]|nr:MAG: hypothetical protein DMF96_17775 [Acidobacteriota bacterium]